MRVVMSSVRYSFINIVQKLFGEAGPDRKQFGCLDGDGRRAVE